MNSIGLKAILILILLIPGASFAQNAVDRSLATRNIVGGANVTDYFTADLAGIGGISGAANYKVFSNGNRELTYFLLVTDIPDDTVLTIEIDNVAVAQPVVAGGQITGTIATPANVPTVNENSVITAKRGAQTLATGNFARAVIRPYTIFTADGIGTNVLPPTTSQAVASGIIFFDDTTTTAEVLVIGTGFAAPPTSVTFNGPAAPDQTGPAVYTFTDIQSFPTDGTVLFLARGFVELTPVFRGLLSEGLLYVDVKTPQFPDGEVRGQFRLYSPHVDFEGDGISDISLYRPSEGVWYFLNSSDRLARSIRFGIAGDRIVPGDFDGDNIADIAVYRRSGNLGVWVVRRSSDGAVSSTQWGLADDIPVVADFDNDGCDDLTVFRPSNGTWYTRRVSDVIKPRTAPAALNAIVRWGQSGDVPFADDFDGDGRPDLTVYRPSNGTWYILRSSNNEVIYRQWGLATDIPLVGDFDGSGHADIAVFRPSTGMWYLLNGLDTPAYVRFGSDGDIPAAGDYDGDGATDVTVFRPSNGTWYGLKSTNNEFFAARFGQKGDLPTAAQ